MAAMSSRRRMLLALGSQEPDRAPCSFMLFNTLRDMSSSYEDFVGRQTELGMDTYVQVPPRPPAWVSDHLNVQGLPVTHHPDVRVKEWVERRSGEEFPVMVKEYETPAGTLRAEVLQTSDWPWGDHLPFLDDFLSSRSRRFIVNGPEDLPCLRYLLMPPTAAQVAASRATSEAAITIARRDDLLLAGGWGVGADLFGWVYGLERMIYAMYDQPEFVRELLDIVAAWNRARMEAVLRWGIDLYIKRAWYENLDFFSPALWRKFIFPTLKAEADLAHEHGAKFGYLITSNCMPLLDMFVEAGVDAVIGVDPEQWDLAETKTRLGGRICLWGGVNGHHTVEEGDEDEVREAVRRAMAVLSPGGGFVLSPVDNVRQPSLHSLAMARVMLDEWRRLTGQALL